MAHHNLKILPWFFKHVADGEKRLEVKLNDRNFQVGDTITLHECKYEGGKFVYTLRKVSAKISYIDNFGMQEGYVNLSLADVGLLIIGEHYGAVSN